MFLSDKFICDLLKGMLLGKLAILRKFSRYEQANISSLLVKPFIFYVSFNFPAWMLKAAKVCYCIEHIELFKLCVCVCVFFFFWICVAEILFV